MPQRIVVVGGGAAGIGAAGAAILALAPEAQELTVHGDAATARALERAFAEAVRHGLTGVHDAGVSLQQLALRAFSQEGQRQFVNIYRRGAIAEFVAILFIPLVALGFRRLAEGRGLTLAALAYAVPSWRDRSAASAST